MRQSKQTCLSLSAWIEVFFTAICWASTLTEAICIPFPSYLGYVTMLNQIDDGDTLDDGLKEKLTRYLRALRIITKLATSWHYPSKLISLQVSHRHQHNGGWSVCEHQTSKSIQRHLFHSWIGNFFTTSLVPFLWPCANRIFKTMLKARFGGSWWWGIHSSRIEAIVSCNQLPKCMLEAMLTSWCRDSLLLFIWSTCACKSLTRPFHKSSANALRIREQTWFNTQTPQSPYQDSLSRHSLPVGGKHEFSSQCLPTYIYLATGLARKIISLLLNSFVNAQGDHGPSKEWCWRFTMSGLSNLIILCNTKAD